MVLCDQVNAGNLCFISLKCCFSDLISNWARLGLVALD